jgi:phage terminase small subunit
MSDDSAAPPAELSDQARAVWLRLFPVLWSRGMLRTRGQRSQFELLCFALGTLAEQDENLVRDGLTVIGRDGAEQPHPSIEIKALYMEHARESLGVIGLAADDPDVGPLLLCRSH